MRKILLLAFFIGLFIQLSAQSNDELMKAGNEYYTNNEYEKALETYLEILETDYEAFELYFNIGNAYYKTENYVRAILYYEKAKLLKPDNEDLLHNLQIVNSHTIDKIEAVPQLFITQITGAFLSSLHSNAWAIFSVVSFWGFLILLSIFLFSNKSFIKKLTFLLAIIVLSISVATFAFSLKQKNALLSDREAIILNSPVKVKSSPGENEIKLFEIHKGTKVKILEEIMVKKEESEWYKVKLKDGKTGWIKKMEVEII